MNRWAIVLCCLVTTAVFALPLGTSFTYQGQLKQLNADANGAFDFEFRLFDTESGGIAIAPSPVVLDDISVVDGIFTVELDFGVTPFAGDRLWLEISVRPGASISGYTGLLPRQELTAVPYALHTENVAAGAVGSAEVDQTQVQLRVVGSCPAGSSIRVVGQDGTVSCQASGDAGGDITAVIAGTGLTGGSITGDATLNVDATQIQSRINSSCPAGQSVRSVDASGNVVCEADDDTTYSAGTGIILNSTTFSVDPSAVQARVTGTCPPGSYMQAIDADGLVSCFDDEIGGGNVIIVAKSGGDFTSVTAAMNAIGVDPDYPASSSSNRYLVRVAPGEYDDEDIDMQPYVDIEGSGQGVTVLRSVGGSGGLSPNSATLVGADYAELRHVTVENTAADPAFWVFAIYASKETTFRNVTAVSTGGARARGMLIHTGGNVTMTNVTVKASGATVSNFGLDLFAGVATVDGLFAEATGGDLARGIYLNTASSEILLENITTHASGGAIETTGLRADLSSVTIEGLRSIAISSASEAFGIRCSDPGYMMRVLGATIYTENTASNFAYGGYVFNCNFELRDAVVDAVASGGDAIGVRHFQNDESQSANVTLADVELRAESSGSSAYGLLFDGCCGTPAGTYGRVTDLNARAIGGSDSLNTYVINHAAVGDVQYRGLSLVAAGAADLLYGILTTGDGTPRFDDVVIDAVGEAESFVFGVEFNTDSTTLTNARVKAVNFDTGTTHEAVGVKVLNASNVALTDVTIYAEAESFVWGAALDGSETRLVRVDTRAVTNSGVAYGVRCLGDSSTIHDSLFRGDSAASSSYGIHVTDCDSELFGSEFIAAGSVTGIGLWGESTSGQSNTIEVRDSFLSGLTNSIRTLGAGAISVEVVMSQLDGGAGLSESATDAQVCTAVTYNSGGSEMFQSVTSDPCP